MQNMFSAPPRSHVSSLLNKKTENIQGRFLNLIFHMHYVYHINYYWKVIMHGIFKCVIILSIDFQDM
jgi:hypothetical protein